MTANVQEMSNANKQLELKYASDSTHQDQDVKSNQTVGLGIFAATLSAGQYTRAQDMQARLLLHLNVALAIFTMGLVNLCQSVMVALL